MPHSPRWHKGKLYVLDSGRGDLLTVDPQSGDIEVIAFLPGYARGLAFIDNCAVIGLSLPRKEGNFGGLPLDEALARRKAERRAADKEPSSTSEPAIWCIGCGLKTPSPNCSTSPPSRSLKRPYILGFQTPEIRHTIVADME